VSAVSLSSESLNSIYTITLSKAENLIRVSLAQTEAPGLSVVQVTADGSLQGLGELDQQIEKDLAEEGGAILIAQLLGLLSTFVGIAFALRLVQDAWPDAAFGDHNSGKRGEHEPTR